MFASKPVIRRILRIAGGAIAVLLAIVLILSIFRVSIPLGFLRPKIETAVSEALGREFRMGGAPRVVIGLKPALKIERCSIGNPADWPGDQPFAQLDRFFVKLGLVPLLRKELRIDDLEISGLTLNLQEQADGQVNWAFDRGRDETVVEPEKVPPSSGSGFQFHELRRLSIEGVNLKSFGPEGEKNLHLALDSVEGRAAGGEDLALDLSGTFQGKPFNGHFKGDSFRELVADSGPWPYEFSADFVDASIGLTGALGTRDRQTAGEHDFEFKVPDVGRIEQFTGPLPKIGALTLKGKLRFTTKGYAMPVLTGNLGETELKGEMNVDTTGEIPRVSGNLNLGSLNIAVFKKPEGTAPDASAKPVPAEDNQAAAGDEPEEEAGQASRPEDWQLLPVVGEIRLTIDEVVNSKVKVQNLELGLKVDQSFLTADVSVNFAEAPLRGDLEIRKHDRAENPVTVALELEAKNADIGELVTFYTGTPGFKGLFERLNYTIRGAGSDMGEAWIQKQVGLEITNAAMTFQGKEKATEFQLDRGFIDGAWNRESRMGADGVFLGETFSLKYNRLKSDRSAAAGRAPFLEFTGTAAGATWRMAGETPREETDPKLPFDFEVSGESLGALHNWVGIPKKATLPYGARGTILFENGWRLNLAEGNLGQTTLSGEIGVRKSEDESAYLAKLAIGTLDFRELKPLLGKGAGETDDTGGFSLDTPLLPAGVHVDDAEVDLKIEKLVFEDSEISGLMLAAEVRDGWVEKAPFGFTLHEKRFEGIGAFDFRNDQPEAGFTLNVDSVDVGAILESIKVAEGLDFQAGKLGLRVHARGETLREILVESDLAVNFSEATWNIQDINSGAKLPITIDGGFIGGKRGESTVISMDGKLGETPLKLKIETDGIDGMIKEGEQINLALDAEIAGSKIEIKGRALLPLDRTDLDAELTWTGEKLSDLDVLLGVDLPPVGPLSLKGRIQVVEAGYSISGLDLKIGETDLKGNLSLDTTGKRPSLEADLSTNRFQINDFALETWTPKSGAKPTVPQRAVAADRKFAKVASAEFLGRLDAKVTLRADDVRSGKDALGSGSLTAQLKDGRFNLAPLKVAIPGGEILASFYYYPRAKTYDWELNLKTDRFDYGILARRKDPETDMTGFLDVDVALKNTNAPLTDFVLAHSTGHVNFEVCPELMRAGIFDFWGANLLFAILPRVDPERNSKINCILGHMKIENGLMTPEALGIDTTRVRVITEGTIDFKNDKIDLLLVPAPKRPEFLRAGTKLMVKGTFDDFDIDTGPMPILRSLARMAGSTVLFPGNLLFQKRIPEDGSDVCSCGKP